MHHTNTSSMGSDSTTSLFFRDLGARWLTTRSQERRAFERLGKSSAAARALLCTQIWDVALGRHTDGHPLMDTHKSEIGPATAPPAKRGCGKYGRTRYFNAGG